MRHTRLVSNSLIDAKDWVLDASEAPSEKEEVLSLRKAHAAILWAARQIDARIITLDNRRNHYEAAKAKAGKAYRAWQEGKGEGENLHDRRQERPA